MWFRNCKYGTLISVLIILLLIIGRCRPVDFEREIKLSDCVIEKVSPTEATIQSAVIDSGDGISSCGHCWSEFPNPTILDSSTSFKLLKNAKPIYESQIFNLKPGKIYYVRAYALKSKKIIYGKETNFSTKIFTLPGVVTKNITSGHGATFTVEGELLNFGQGFDNIIDYGHCWSQNPEPTINDSKSSFGTTDSLLVFSSTAENLTVNDTYYIRAYATNSVGTVYGRTYPVHIPKYFINTSFISRGANKIGNDEGDKSIPYHNVVIDSFYIANFEVTNKQFCDFLNQYSLKAGNVSELINLKENTDIILKDTYYFPNVGLEDFPVRFVSWIGANEFARFVGGRLPTEAEWEYVARGWTNSTNNETYSGSFNIDNVAVLK